MLLSQHYNLKLSGLESWFDPIIDDDTLLFVDPFLIYLDNDGIFKGSYEKIMDFFSKVFEEAATIPYIVGSPRLNVLTNKVIFKEPKEACLGYSIGNVDGAGSGAGFAKIIITAIYDSINAGINDLNHFEELGIFNSNIKEDRISDLTINILKKEFILFTQGICSQHSIPMRSLPCRVFDLATSRWVVKKFNLPQNPFNNGPIILLPKKFLASINALNSNDFFDYCWEQFDDNVKDQLNVEIKSRVDKKKIVDLARGNPDWVNSYLSYKESQQNSNAYDLTSDPGGVYLWHQITEKYVKENPIQNEVIDQNDALKFLDDVCEKFQDFIENHDGYLFLLDTSSKPKREKASQLLLYGMLKHYSKSIGCKLETKEAGKGIVKLKFSSGVEKNIFLEIKYVRNSEILKALNTLLNKLQTGDEVIFGQYLLVAFKQQELQLGLNLEDNLLELAADHNLRLKFKVINAIIN
jgi:hypothetical protein